MSLLFFFFSESLFAAALLHEEIETDSNPAFSRHSGYKSNLMCLSLSSTLPALHTPSFVGVGPSTYFFFSFLLHVLLFKKKGRTTRGGREVKREKIKKQLKHHSQEKKLRKMGHRDWYHYLIPATTGNLSFVRFFLFSWYFHRQN